MTGTVLRFFSARGFGFLKSDDPAVTREVFVHYTDIAMLGYRDLCEGQRVEFDVEQTDKGLRAKRVVPAEL